MAPTKTLAEFTRIITNLKSKGRRRGLTKDEATELAKYESGKAWYKSKLRPILNKDQKKSELKDEIDSQQPGFVIPDSPGKTSRLKQRENLKEQKNRRIATLKKAFDALKPKKGKNEEKYEGEDEQPGIIKSKKISDKSISAGLSKILKMIKEGDNFDDDIVHTSKPKPKPKKIIDASEDEDEDEIILKPTKNAPVRAPRAQKFPPIPKPTKPKKKTGYANEINELLLQLKYPHDSVAICKELDDSYTIGSKKSKGRYNDNSDTPTEIAEIDETADIPEADFGAPVKADPTMRDTIAHKTRGYMR